MTAMANDAKQEPVNKMGVILDLAQHTVLFGGYAVRVDNVNAGDISFSGRSTPQVGGRPGVTVAIWGDVDRVTGHLMATQTSTVSSFTYDLLCKPASRLF